MADVALSEELLRMRLICLLNHCQHFPGFVYDKARLCPDSGRIEIDVRPRRRFEASMLGLPSTGHGLRPTQPAPL